jgi:hypothetical protein
MPRPRQNQATDPYGARRRRPQPVYDGPKPSPGTVPQPGPYTGGRRRPTGLPPSLGGGLPGVKPPKPGAPGWGAVGSVGNTTPPGVNTGGVQTMTFSGNRPAPAPGQMRGPGQTVGFDTQADPWRSRPPQQPKQPDPWSPDRQTARPQPYKPQGYNPATTVYQGTRQGFGAPQAPQAPQGPPPNVDPGAYNALVQLGISQGMPPALAAQKAAALFGPDGQRIPGSMTITQAEAEAAGLNLSGGGLMTGAMGQPTSNMNGPGGIIDQANQALAAGIITPQQHADALAWAQQNAGSTYNVAGQNGQSMIGGPLPGQASTPGVQYTQPGIPQQGLPPHPGSPGGIAGIQTPPPSDNPLGFQAVPTPGPAPTWPGGLPPGAHYLGGQGQGQGQGQAPQSPWGAPPAPQPDTGSVQGATAPNPSQTLPLSPQFEASRRAASDQLSATLAQIGVAREEIPAMVNMITARMGTDQAFDTNMLNEAMNGRGLYDSGIRAQDTQQLNQGYDRQRQDMAFDVARQYRDLATQESQARLSYEQQLAEMLLELAQETIGDPSAPIEGVAPYDLDYDPALTGKGGMGIPRFDMPKPGGRKKPKGRRRKK